MKLELGKMKLEFKKELVPICIFYFFVLLCFGLIQPYFTLQLRTLGLTLDDAALVGASSLPHSWIDQKILFLQRGANPSLNLSNPVERWDFSFCRLYMRPYPWIHRGQGCYHRYHHSPCACPLHWWSSHPLPSPSMTLKAL